jgi:hypothetical protein
MSGNLMNNPKHWRDRAEEARANGEQMNDPEAKRQMYEIAGGVRLQSQPRGRKLASFVKCLRCGHRGVLREADLPSYGEKPDAPIAAFVKRLKCRQCGSRSVQAFQTN